MVLVVFSIPSVGVMVASERVFGIELDAVNRDENHQN